MVVWPEIAMELSKCESVCVRGHQRVPLLSEGTTREKRSHQWKHRLTLKIEQDFRKFGQHWTTSDDIRQHQMILETISISGMFA